MVKGKKLVKKEKRGENINQIEENIKQREREIKDEEVLRRSYITSWQGCIIFICVRVRFPSRNSINNNFFIKCIL